MRAFIWLLILTLSCGCLPDKKGGVSTPFNVQIHDIKEDSLIMEAACFGTDYIFRTEDNRIIVLDSSFKNKRQLQVYLNSHRIERMLQRNDTLWFGRLDPEMNYSWSFLNNKHELVPVALPYLYKDSLITSFNTLYSDSLYTLFEGCAGEFGGTIFFYNKAKRVSYSYPAMCPSQAFSFKGKYYIVSNSSHLFASTSVVAIDNPEMLYVTPVEKYEGHIVSRPNWWVSYDSIRENASLFTNKERGVSFVDSSSGSQTTLGFVYNDALYFIRNDSNNYWVLQHKDGRMDTVQKIPFSNIGTVIEPYYTYTYKEAYLSVTHSYKSTPIGNMNAGISASPSHVIVVKGGVINILKFGNQPS